MRNNSSDFEIIENELNLSTKNIMDSLNKKIENDRRKKEKSKRIAAKITAAAAAAVVCIAGIRVADTVISSSKHDNAGVNSIVNKDAGDNTGIQPASYLSDAFVMKVYAAEDGGYISVDNGNKVLIDKLAKTTGYSILSNGGTEVMIKLPVMCEGENIESVKYQFDNNSSIFAGYYDIPEEIAALLTEHSDDSEKNKENHEKFHSYCYANNLMLRVSTDKETGKSYGFQRMDSTYEVPYDSQDTRGLNFIIRDYGDITKRDEDGRISLNKILQNQVLTVTVTLNDGSTVTKKYSFEADDDDGKNMPLIKIYEISN